MASDDRQKKVDEALCSLRSLIAGDETIHSGDKIDADEFHHALQRIAAEIEAAWKRERAEIEAQALSIGGIVESSRHTQKPQGNAAAMREALEYVIQWREDCISEEGADNVDDMMAVVNAALSAPPRQCDVGTPDDQSERFRAFCKKGKLPQFAESAYCAHECCCRDAADCKFAWAQMSYEKGGAE